MDVSFILLPIVIILAGLVGIGIFCIRLLFRISVAEKKIQQLQSAINTHIYKNKLAPTRSITYLSFNEQITTPLIITKQIPVSPAAIESKTITCLTNNTNSTTNNHWVNNELDKHYQHSFFDKAIKFAKDWLTTGNIPVKIGILVLLGGVIALFKYAADEGYLSLSIEWRLAGVMVGSTAALLFAWYKRESKRSFSLSIQGGAIGLMLLTVFAAAKLFSVISSELAFAISLLLIALTGWMAIIQNAKALAVFSLLAGFLAPIWLNDNSGNYIGLFSYYTLLNISIMTMAWWRSWRFINLLGFFFTFGIATLWGLSAYTPDKFSTTEPFLLIFFSLYLIIPILFARKQRHQPEDFDKLDLFQIAVQIIKGKASEQQIVDGSLIFGTPLVAFCLQIKLLDMDQALLAYNALGLSVLYTLLAWYFIKKSTLPLLGQSFAVLAFGFITLSVPLAFSANATSGIFALEGAAAIWLGLKQQKQFTQYVGAGLQILAGGALINSFGNSNTFAFVSFSPLFFSLGFLTLSTLISAWLYHKERYQINALCFYLIGLSLWIINGVNELDIALNNFYFNNGLIIFATFTAWIAAEIYRLQKGKALIYTVTAGIIVSIILLAQIYLYQIHTIDKITIISTLIYAALSIRNLQCIRGEHKISLITPLLWWIGWLILITCFLWQLTNDSNRLGESWNYVSLIAPALLFITIYLFKWHWLTTPFGFKLILGYENEKLTSKILTNVKTLFITILMVLAAQWWGMMLFISESAAPLPYIPMLNPIEISQLVLIALTYAWLRSDCCLPELMKLKIHIISASCFCYLSSIVLHTVHYWGNIPWDINLLTESLTQTSLTLLWSILGMLSWIMGSRRSQRLLWLSGAILMGIVLVKLILIDRSNLGNVLGIASFIAYGLLCIIVGYIAPAPPKNNSNN